MSHFYTWDKLAKNSARLNPKTRGVNYPATPKFERILILPYVGTKSCLVKLQAYGVTQANNLHQVTLLFNDCEILTGEQDVSLWDYFKIDYKNEVYYVKKFDRLRNPLTSRCTCFTGDTRILLSNGEEKSFTELEGKEFDVVSYNAENDTFDIVHAFNCAKRKEKANLLRITLDNNKKIDCTPEHRFLTRDGRWVRAKDLRINESLRAFYGKSSKNRLFRLLTNGDKQKIKKHKPELKYYNYVYLDPRYPGNYEYESCSFNYKPIYVGKGCSKRFLKHLDSKTDDPFHNTLRKLKWLGLEPIILIQNENLSESVAYKLERELTEEIGLACENKGPLLNLKHGGEGGLSGIAKISVQEHMKFNNPMSDNNISKKVSQQNELNGNHEKFRQLFKNNNPMKNPECVKKNLETKSKHYTKEQIHQWAVNASHSRTEETFRKIKESLKNSDIAKKAQKVNGARLAEYNRKLASEGKHHTQTEEWRKARSISSKKNWLKPGFKEKIIGKRESRYKKYPELKIKADRTRNITKSAKAMSEYIKINGNFNELEFSKIKSNGYMKLENLKKLGLYNEALKKAYELARFNHKIIKIEQIESQDVYCLTTEYLGNFIVSTPDNNSSVISGVVVANCKDSFFSWSWYNYYKGHCLYGPPPKPYRRKTTTRPPRNPNGYIGICKHVYNAWDYLKREGLTLN